MSEDFVLRTEGLKKWYKIGGIFSVKGYVRAVDGVDVTIRKGEVYCVVGESGCGKSTLARTIMGLEEITSGEIYFNASPSTAKLLEKKGEKVHGTIVKYSELSEKGLRILKRDMQMVFQDPYASLDPKMKIWEIVAEPVLVHKLASKKKAREIAAQALEKVKLGEEFLDRYPHELSGGQKQRVMIARALSISPKFIVADEPVSMLDVSIRAEIIHLLKEIRDKENVSLMVITHDLATTPHLCDRIGVMYLGKIVEEGPTREVIENPLHPYTKALMAAVLEPSPENRKRRIEVPIKGEVGVPPERGCRFLPRCVLVDQIEGIRPMCSEKEPPLVGDGHKVACWGAKEVHS
ncbi:peptide ABC transporter ATPase [Ignicoccus islandicus DSM 13165]|uniref:Peptide ABC transporter ATPase n=1 Tax=Ignicoccus islandicus DSM 13165 TaxID=940295 RepID=A0A0U2WKL5_9CREN|nr:ABC transporter ATP-binding protein [Ignicoccus islandicus]ALU11473.1 peptide ABC transporter ATPase [Ignicoccus islandicus DSM 13165]